MGSNHSKIGKQTISVRIDIDDVRNMSFLVSRKTFKRTMLMGDKRITSSFGPLQDCHYETDTFGRLKRVLEFETGETNVTGKRLRLLAANNICSLLRAFCCVEPNGHNNEKSNCPVMPTPW